MHNVSVESILRTVELSGERQTREGAPQFQGRIPRRRA